MSEEFTLTQPVSVWNRNIKASFSSLFKNLGSAAASASFGDWKGVSTSAVAGLADLGLETKPGEHAWRLIFTAISQATERLVKEESTSNRIGESVDIESIGEKLEAKLLETEVTLNSAFFENPTQLPFLTFFKTCLKDWLIELNLPEPKASATIGRFDWYYLEELNREWQGNPAYDLIRKVVDTPFTKAELAEQKWFEYVAYLQRQVREPMFEESFSLADVYISLKGNARRKAEESKKRHRLDVDSDDFDIQISEYETYEVNLDDHLFEWCLADPKDDALRVISGGPGSGKSSFCKMFAAEHAEQLRSHGIYTLFIPLHHFDPKGDMEDAVSNYIQQTDCLAENPIGINSNKVLLIFDGLDELSQSGSIGAEVAKGFVNNVVTSLGRKNAADTKLKVLLSGRELIVQSCEASLRGKILIDVLPYKPEQCDEWWRKYGSTTGYRCSCLPEDLQSEDFADIVNQPLLNYLVALAKYDDEGNEIVMDADTSLNRVYEILVERVYERAWSPNGNRQYVGELSEKQFMLILEEIAVSAWHGDGRKTSERSILEHIKDANLEKLLNTFKDGAQKGVTKLLLAFFFRKCEMSGIEQDHSFEFTHKSFGEYLTARRLFRLMERVVKERELNEEGLGEGWDASTCLIEWAKVTGITRMDEYLYKFLEREVVYRSKKEKVPPWKWQQLFAQLWKHAVVHGTEMEQAFPNDAFQLLKKRAINAEESLLAAHAAIAQITKKVVPLSWSERQTTAVGTWIRSIQGQRIGFDTALVLRCTHYLDLSKQELSVVDLFSANLIGSDLTLSVLEYANLEGTKLLGACLDRAVLAGASLRGANLFGANMKEAYLGDSNLRAANLLASNLMGVCLEGANLQKTKIDKKELSIEQRNALIDSQIRNRHKG